MQKQVVRLIISLVVNVVGGIVAFFLLKDPLLTGLVVLATVLCTVIVLLFWRVEEISRTVTDFKESSSPRPPPCCGLHLAGVSQVFEKASESLNLTVENVSNNYRFLGVTAQFVLDIENFKELITQKTIEKGCRFQMLLLDPDAEETIALYSRGMRMGPEALTFRLRQSVAELKALAGQCDGKLEVWLYHDLPIFRLVLVDDERMYVSFYGAKGIMGVHTPQFVFLKTDQSFFIPFSNFYEETLRRSNRLI